MDKLYVWDDQKNGKLKIERNISFEEIVYAIDNGNLIKTVENPSGKNYRNQYIHLVLVHGYVYVVPFVEDKDHIFLKTIFPSRKATELYRKGGFAP